MLKTQDSVLRTTSALPVGEGVFVKRIPSLDGIRAVSILCVMLAHLEYTAGSPRIFRSLGSIGDLGVQTFFVLSGFLITTLLKHEFALQGRISLREFYYRRLIRIFPAGYSYLLVVTVFAGRYIGALRLGSAWLYITNFYTLPHNSSQFLVGHLWSLSVEEQFYFMWPLILKNLLKHYRSAVPALSTVIVLGPLCRLFCYLAFGAGAGGNWRGAHFFPCVADALATGALLSLAYSTVTSLTILKKKIFLFVPTAVLAMYVFPTNAWFFNLAGVSLANAGIALTIAHCILVRYRLLNMSPVVWLGTLSYSLYLWQQPYLNHFSTQWYARTPVNIALAFISALLCHYLIELPFLRLRHKHSVGPAS